jgi:FkbH-like protein
MIKTSDVLLKPNLTLAELTKIIELLLLEKDFDRKISIGISSSVTIELLKVYLQKHAILNNVSIDFHIGNFDDPIGDVDQFVKSGVEQMILLPFFDTLFPSFEAQIDSLDASIIEAKELEMRQRYRMAFDKAHALSAIYLCTFHRLGNAVNFAGQDSLSVMLARFNAALREEAAPYVNIRLIDTEDIVRTVGQRASFDSRFYFRSKAPYTGAYMNELAQRIAGTARGFGSYFFKVLVLDCDNTLWGGVIGEDHLDGIKLGPHDYPGNIYWRIQQEFLALERQGVLLALVSKNNPADVNEVLCKHPGMVLGERHIVAKKINWDDKPSNLRALAKELNLGLDSFVFLDDSSFECEAVRQQLPMVKTLQVPATLTDYPRIVAEIKTLFLAGGITADSNGKTEQYRQRAGAVDLKAQFKTHEEYLASLDLNVELTRNATVSSSRISELSQKSNQFNLTTCRYSQSGIERMMEDDNYNLYSLVVSDKFGNAGLTGVAVIRYEDNIAMIENFFMSCRVIGRGVETSIWARIASDANKRGYTELHAKFIPSGKNAQVADFFDSLGMPMIKEANDGTRYYAVAIDSFAVPSNSWIKMIYVE